MPIFQYIIKKSFLRYLLIYTVFLFFSFTNTTNALNISNYEDPTDKTGDLQDYELLDEYGFANNTTDFTSGAEMTANVFYNSVKDLFLYQFDINPALNQHLSTIEINVIGPYDNLYAGSSFSNTSYNVVYDNSSTLTFQIFETWNGTSGEDDIMSFYYESMYAPGNEYYYIYNAVPAGRSLNFAPDSNSTFVPPSPVPEPGTMVLLLTGFGCLAGVKIRNKFNLKKRNR